MTPTEKAKELIDRFNQYAKDSEMDKARGGETFAAEIALIAVDEIIKSNPYFFYPNRKVTRVSDHSTKEYWKEVKYEIERTPL